MDQKTWLWKKKPSEKTIVTTGEEAQSVPSEKEVELENSLKALTEKLDSVLHECSAKDELVQNYEKIAEDAAADKQKADEEIQRLKQELDEALQQRVAANERLGHLNSALKDSMQTLNLVRQEQDQRVQDAVMKTSVDIVKSQKQLAVENSYLSKAIVVKDRMIEDLKNCKCQTDAEFDALMTRLDNVEKENAFLRYEARSFEKELDLRNEELDYSHRSVESSQKQHLESVKKIKKLEAECQRLRSFTRKRLPNPATLANMKSDARDSRILIDHVRDLEKENEILKECLVRKEEEIFCFKKVKNSAPDVLSLSSGCGGVVDSNEIVCSNSWASEMNLMDDFVEMEKLAIVAIDPPKGGSSAVSKKPDDWLENVVNVILEQHGISQRSLDELLGDVKMVLNSLTCAEPPKLLPISGYITWKSPISSPRSSLVDNHSKVRDEFKKHLGGDGPGTAFELESVQKLMFEVEKIYSDSQTEIEGLKNELNSFKSMTKDFEVSLNSVRQENETLTRNLQQSQQSVASLLTELEISEESKRGTEDQVENQKLINEDLETQLGVTKVKLNEALQKLSSIEVELDDKSHCCEELEGTCVDLQLQLESITSNRYSEDSENHEELLQTGLEITKASARLGECEQTILKLGEQLKALGSTKELAVVEKVLSITDTNNKKFKQRPSLHDMLCEDGADAETISRTEAANAFSFPEGQGTTPKAYLGQTHGSKRFKAGALVIVPSKNKGGISFLRKLLLKKKKTSSKNKTFYFGK